MMDSPVKLELYKNGYLFSEFTAEKDSDLRCRIEMLTGIAWLDISGLYLELLDKGCDEIRETFRVCNSYEKWDDWQQEVAEVTVWMRRV